MVPVIVPAAAVAANAPPSFRARKSATGADVNGKPTSQPLTAGPQRRPARLAVPISVGVRTSFRTRVSTLLWECATTAGSRLLPPGRNSARRRRRRAPDPARALVDLERHDRRSHEQRTGDRECGAVS